MGRSYQNRKNAFANNYSTMLRKYQPFGGSVPNVLVPGQYQYSCS